MPQEELTTITYHLDYNDANNRNINRNNIIIRHTPIDVGNYNNNYYNYYYNNYYNIPAQPVVIHNQTVHDRETEETIQEAITKLKARYEQKEPLYLTLEEVVKILEQKAFDLLKSKHLNLDEIKVIKKNFLNLLSVTEDQKNTAKNLLNLAIQALNDEKAAQEMLGHEPSVIDNQERWSGWFKSSIIDSQLAYRRDRGDTTFPTDEELDKDTSCFGGSLNRIIAALNLIHPDVRIVEGQGTLENMQQYRQNRDIAKIKKFGMDLTIKEKNIVKQYLETFSLEILKSISLELEQVDIGKLAEKSQSLLTFEKGLEEHIINNAKLLLLEIEDVDLIKKELEPFIFAYIEGFLQEEINDIIKSLSSQCTSTSKMRI